MDTGLKIFISVLVTAFVVATLVTTYFMKDKIGAIASTAKKSNIPSWLMILYYFLPYSLFLFGVINDGITRNPQYSLGSVAGMFAIFMNTIISKLFTGAPIEDNDVCGIPGLRFLSSNIIPQNMLFNLTVLSYIAMLATLQNPGTLDETLPGWMIVIVVWIIHSIIFKNSNCQVDINGNTLWAIPNFWGTIIVGLLISAGIGSGFAALAFYEVLPPSASAPAGNNSGGGSGVSGMNQCYAIPGSGSDDSDNQFVCEAYKNGELITSTIVE